MRTIPDLAHIRKLFDAAVAANVDSTDWPKPDNTQLGRLGPHDQEFVLAATPSVILTLLVPFYPMLGLDLSEDGEHEWLQFYVDHYQKLPEQS